MATISVRFKAYSPLIFSVRYIVLQALDEHQLQFIELARPLLHPLLNISGTVLIEAVEAEVTIIFPSRVIFVDQVQHTILGGTSYPVALL